LSELQLASAEESEGLGAALAHSVPWTTPRALTLFVTGELGTGKTTLARGLLRALGVEDVVRSPSYTLVESYEPAGHRVLHLDLYRLGDTADMEALGLRDELDEGVLLVVEWPERAPARLPLPSRCAWRARAASRGSKPIRRSVRDGCQPRPPGRNARSNKSLLR
jgi:tRNA threonylcarbamoyladenosine biosynthesis protein TsaE